jgi:hypothetical protein
MLLPRFLHFASITISASRFSTRPRYRPSPADSPPVSIPRPSSLGAWMDSGLAWRGIELLGRRRSRMTAKRVAA